MAIDFSNIDFGERDTSQGGRRGGRSRRRLPTGPPQSIPSPQDVGMPQRRGFGAWAGNKFMGFLDWLNGFSRVGTQTVADADILASTGQWNPEYSWYDYVDEGDPHRALGTGLGVGTQAVQGAFMGAGIGAIGGAPGALIGGVVGGIAGAGIGLWEYLNLDTIPDTPEQAAIVLREKAERIKATTDSPFVSKMAEALPWLSAFYNEQTMAEIAFDPLAAITDFGPLLKQTAIGMRMAGAIERGAGKTWTFTKGLPLVGGAAEFAEKRILELPARAARRMAERGMDAPAAQYATFQSEVFKTRDEFYRELQAVRKTVGNEGFEQAHATLAKLIEDLPEAYQISEDVARQAMDEILASPPAGTLPFAEAAQGAQDASRIDWFKQEMTRAFPELPDTAHELGANFLDQSVTTSAMMAAYENAKGIPTHTLNDIQYLYHLVTKGFLDAKKKALGTMTGDDLSQYWAVQTSLRNKLGGNMTDTLKRRSILKSLEEINAYSPDSRVGFIKGKADLVFLEVGEAVPDNFIPIVGKVFSDNPFHVMLARAARSVNATTSVDFWHNAARTFGQTVVDKANAPPGGFTLKGALNNETEWGKTFGFLERSARPQWMGTLEEIYGSARTFGAKHKSALQRAVNSIKKLHPDADVSMFEGVSSSQFKKILAENIENPETKALVESLANTYFPDKETAKGVLRQFQAMRNIERKPGPIMRWFARNKRLWGAMTLTPFPSSWSRNLIGGDFVNAMRFGNKARLIGIEQFFKMLSGKVDEEYVLAKNLGLFGRDQASVLFQKTDNMLTQAPYLGTPLQSNYQRVMKSLSPLELGEGDTFIERLKNIDANVRPKGEGEFYGRTAYEFIDNHQRWTAFKAARVEGQTVEEAVKTAMTLHFDYGDMPQWFKDLNPFLAFPTWSLKQVPLQIELMFRNPAYASKWARFATASQEATGMSPAETPEMIQEGGGFGIPSYREDKPMWVRPENFHPMAIFSDISEPFRFAYDMFNPMVTEPLEQLAGAKRNKSMYGGPSTWDEALALDPRGRFAPGVENVGYDPFLDRPIVRDYTKFNEWMPVVGNTKMPDWAQRVDHAAKSFLRYYSEWGSTLKIVQKETLPKQEGYAELFSRRVAGIPLYWPDMNQAVYFNLKDVDKRIAAAEGKSTQDPNELKQLYLSRLALLSHGTFAQRDPFDPDRLRHWADYGTTEDEFTLVGKRQMWQEAISTAWLLLLGSTGPENAQRIRVDIPLDETEEQYIEGLLHRLLDTYTIELGNASVRESDVDYGRGIGYVEDRQEYMGGTQ